GVEVVEDEPVHGGGAVSALEEPPAVAEHLEVPAHGGLGELEDGGDLAHGELFALEEAAEAQADGLAQGGETLGDRDGVRGPLHPFIRMKCRRTGEALSTRGAGDPSPGREPRT